MLIRERWKYDNFASVTLSHFLCRSHRSQRRNLPIPLLTYFHTATASISFVRLLSLLSCVIFILFMLRIFKYKRVFHENGYLNQSLSLQGRMGYIFPSSAVSKHRNVCQPTRRHTSERGESPERSPLITLTNRYAPQTCYNFVIPRYIIIAILVARITLLIYHMLCK